MSFYPAKGGGGGNITALTVTQSGRSYYEVGTDKKNSKVYVSEGIQRSYRDLYKNKSWR